MTAPCPRAAGPCTFQTGLNWISACCCRGARVEQLQQDGRESLQSVSAAWSPLRDRPDGSFPPRVSPLPAQQTHASCLAHFLKSATHQHWTARRFKSGAPPFHCVGTGPRCAFPHRCSERALEQSAKQRREGLLSI